MDMQIVISNFSEKPIYTQIEESIKDMIISGQLKKGDMLPSMRALANDLKISLITTKRAYNDLEEEGLIVTYTGKGSFISGINPDSLKEMKLKEIEDDLTKVIESAKKHNVSESEFMDLARMIYRGD